MQDTEYLCISKLEKSTVKIILEYTNMYNQVQLVYNLALKQELHL